MKRMLKYIKNKRRADNIVRSLLTSGYRKVIHSEHFQLYVLRHSNGNEFVVKLSRTGDKLTVTKNGKPIEL